MNTGLSDMHRTIGMPIGDCGDLPSETLVTRRHREELAESAAPDRWIRHVIRSLLALLLIGSIHVNEARAAADDRPAAALTGCTIADALLGDGSDGDRRAAMDAFAAAADAAFKAEIVASGLFVVRSRGTDFDKAGEEDFLVGEPSFDPGASEVQLDCELIGFYDVAQVELNDGGLTGKRWESLRELSAELVVTVQRGRPREIVFREQFQVEDHHEWKGVFRQGEPRKPPADAHDELVGRLGREIGERAARSAIEAWRAKALNDEGDGPRENRPPRDRNGKPARVAIIPSPWNDQAAQQFAGAVQRAIQQQDPTGMVVEVIDPKIVLFSLSNLGAPPPQKGIAASKLLDLQNARGLAGSMGCVAFVIAEAGSLGKWKRTVRDQEIWTVEGRGSIEVVEASGGTSVGAPRERMYSRQERDESNLDDAWKVEVASELAGHAIDLIRKGVADERIRIPREVQEVKVRLEPYMILPRFERRDGSWFLDDRERRNVEATVWITGERQAKNTPDVYRIPVGNQRINIEVNDEFLANDLVTIELDDDGTKARDPVREFIVPAPERFRRIVEAMGEGPVDADRIEEAILALGDIPFVSTEPDGDRVTSGPWNPLRAIGLDE